jgi:hypothetical protein
MSALRFKATIRPFDRASDAAADLDLPIRGMTDRRGGMAHFP